MVTKNLGKAIYIVYSLFTIPIMTILISLASDTFFSRFQRSAERLGTREEEDHRFQKMQQMARRRAIIVRNYIRNLLCRPSKSHGKDVEKFRTTSAPAGMNVQDEIIRDDIMEEIESMEQVADKEMEKVVDGEFKVPMVEPNVESRRRTQIAEQDEISAHELEHAIRQTRDGDGIV